MENVIEFLMNYYFYFATVAFLLILALIGYLVDSRKTQKLKEEFAREREREAIIPAQQISNNIKLGTVLNNTTTQPTANTASQIQAPVQPATQVQPPVQTVQQATQVNPVNQVK